MTQVIVTVYYGRTNRVDLSLPWEVPSELLLKGIPRALGVRSGPQNKFLLAVRRENNFRQISGSETLSDAGVLVGDYLELFHWQRAYLLSDNSQKFWINDLNTLIGRSTPERVVDIDLAELDKSRLISRYHALITHNHNRYSIKDENSRNGVLINGMKLPPGQPHQLKDKDLINFGGKYGVGLTFHQEL